jgi:hypothetical protein
MKLHFIAFSLLAAFLLPMHLTAQDDPVLIMEKWDELTDKQFLADVFVDFFGNLGIRVEETGEEVTIHHKGDSFEIEEGINEDEVDYSITIRTQNILNFAGHAQDGELDDAEIYTTLEYMFTPITARSLKDPDLARNIPKFVRKRENNTHVTLHSPDKSSSVSHTIIYLNKEWIVAPGLYGTPKRVYNMEVQDALLYQRKVLEALKLNTKKDWKAFRRWYAEWRKGVSKAM